MPIRRLVADVGLAALIALPAVLVNPMTPRSVDTKIAAEGPDAILADAGIDRIVRSPADRG
jgi:hypothetical protein